MNELPVAVPPATITVVVVTMFAGSTEYPANMVEVVSHVEIPRADKLIKTLPDALQFVPPNGVNAPPAPNEPSALVTPASTKFCTVVEPFQSILNLVEELSWKAAKSADVVADWFMPMNVPEAFGRFCVEEPSAKRGELVDCRGAAGKKNWTISVTIFPISDMKELVILPFAWNLA